jgi:uncharacterized protein YndB with AHSA1/START domain
MPATAQATPDSNVVIDRTTHVIRFTRNFDAPRATVFEAWTQPEHVSCWWDPAGKRLAECEIDLRPGGTFSFVTEDHPEMPFSGTYLEIMPPDQLVFDANGATGKVVLHESAGRTQMTVTIDCGSSEMLEMYLKMRVEVGTAQTLDNLVTYVSAL